MPDIGAELKRAVEMRSVVEAPDFDLLARRSAHRRSRIRAAAAIAACGLVVMGGVLIQESFTPGDSDPTSGGTATSQTFNVPVSTWRVGQPAYQALVYGVLSFSGENCPYLERRDAEPLPIVFPAGSRGSVDTNGKRSVTDSFGNVYGVEGSSVRYGGGAVSPDSLANVDIKNPCGDLSRTGYWSVQQAPGMP